MQYLLLIAENESRFLNVSEQDNAEMVAAYGAYMQALGQAGVLRGGSRLKPVANATTVRVRDGKTQVLDGPYADTHEQLGGYLLIDVPDLDTALDWAARCPGATVGSIEVRPVWTM